MIDFDLYRASQLDDYLKSLETDWCECDEQTPDEENIDCLNCGKEINEI